MICSVSYNDATGCKLYIIQDVICNKGKLGQCTSDLVVGKLTPNAAGTALEFWEGCNDPEYNQTRDMTTNVACQLKQPLCVAQLRKGIIISWFGKPVALVGLLLVAIDCIDWYHVHGLCTLHSRGRGTAWHAEG